MNGVLTWLAVAALGGAGAVLRALVDGSLRDPASARGRTVVGTLVVNVTGSFAAGLLSGGALGPTAGLLAATAFVGAYSTFSTWMLDVVQAATGGAWRSAGLNLVGSLCLGAVAAEAGLVLGGAL